MPADQSQYNVGDHIEISLNNQIIDATIRAVMPDKDGIKLQVAFGDEQAALIDEWQVVKNA